jgi:hypothetical protein
MGAVSSVKKVYRDAVKWFLMYIDKETYFADFQVLDDDCDGLISFGEFQKWIVHNIKEQKEPENSCWSIFINNGLVIKMAHKAACGHLSAGSSLASRTGVDITEFRSLLIHLYAMNILWRHFACLEMYKEASGRIAASQLSSKKLDEDEFAIAVRGLCAAHAGEQITDEQITKDFMDIDSSLVGQIGFVQVSLFGHTGNLFSLMFTIYYSFELLSLSFRLQPIAAPILTTSRRMLSPRLTPPTGL